MKASTKKMRCFVCPDSQVSARHYATDKRQHTATAGEVYLPWGFTHECRNAEQRDSPGA